MKIGLTGGIGCGKSTVVGLFRDARWLTIESDAVVRELLSRDAELIQAITTRWGDRCKSESEGIDRKVVGQIVFGDSSELKWLEGQLHPRVRKVWKGEIAKYPDKNVLVEIPLLFEKSLESEFDFTVCVHSPEAVVESRMQARGYTREELARRRSHQMPIEEKIRRADFVVTNAGHLEFLNQQIARLIAKFRA
jgi:dephospho-CoA kinase